MFKNIATLLIVAFFLTRLWGSKIAANATPLDSVEPERMKEIVRFAKSAVMRNYLNTSYDPCSDFYRFACGNYYRINRPTITTLQSSFFQTILKSMKRKISLLLSTNEVVDAPIYFRKVKNFYESCMKVQNLENGYRRKLLEIIEEFGGMPALEGAKWQEAEFDWLKTIGQIAHKYDIRLILGYLITVDNTNNTLNRMRIVLQDLPLESVSVYTDDVHKKLRYGHTKAIEKKLRKFLGLDASVAEKTAKEIVEFETNLFAGNSSLTDDDDDDETASEEEVEEEEEEEEEDPEADDTSLLKYLMTIDELQTKYYPNLDIKRLINISYGSVPTGQVYDFIEDDALNIAQVLNATPKRIVANYIFYYLLDNFMLNIPKKQNDLQDLCIATTKSYFSQILDNMVYRRYTINQTEQDVTDMWHSIKGAFQDVLESDRLTWMSDMTRRYAVEKLKTIRMEINSYEHRNFGQELEQLTLTPNDYIENLKSIFSLNALKSRAKLYQTPEPYDDVDASVSPVYIVTENLIKVPVSILQPFYLWSDYYPQALKFGTLGFLLSHELMHGFDEEGRTYDKLGNQHEWWDKASNAYFKNHSACFSSQYERYVYDGRKLPDLDSQSENIADNGGIRLAYEAYLRWYEDALRSYQSTDLETLPRLNYTSKQLFFIAYGQLWCSATHPLLRSFVASTDEHVPDKFRVVGPLSNLEEFSKEFSCRIGSGMNPKKKCVIY